MIITARPVPDPIVLRRQNELFDLYNRWPGDGDPDEDPDFVAAAREIMGLPPLDRAAEDPRAAGDKPDPTPAAKRSEDTDLDDEAAELWRAGDENGFKKYWLGKGLKKWALSNRPWTSLFKHLVKHMPPEKAREVASRWFLEHFGYASGSDKNRVAHGHPPRGDKVGPG